MIRISTRRSIAFPGFFPILPACPVTMWRESHPSRRQVGKRRCFGGLHRRNSYPLDRVMNEILASLEERLGRIEQTLAVLVKCQTIQDWYDTKTAAGILGKSQYRVREWCRLKRVRAEKRPCGRGRSKEWMISHEELERIKSEGLLPLSKD